MSQPIRIEQLDSSLCANGRIEAQHASQLRRLIYAKGSVTRPDAEVLFRLDRTCSMKDEAFKSLFVEALTDYFVWQTQPKGYVTAEQSRFLIENVARDGHVSGATELELVLNIVHWARQVPEDIVLLVLKAVRESVLLSRSPAFGDNRPRVVISAGDVAVLRKALHAPAGDGSLLVTRREADMLFDLNDAAGSGAHDPAWTEFFVHCIANHLLNPTESAVVPDFEEAKRRDRWLDEGGSIGKLLTGVGSALARGDIPFADAWEELDPFGKRAAREEAQAEERATRLRLAREHIDAEEAKWLGARLNASEGLDENERALLRFLKAEATAIDPALEKVIVAAGLQ